MTFKKYMLPIITLFLIAILPDCYSPKIPLSGEDRRFADALEEKYSADISMQHDYIAVKDPENQD
jgi:hypothetical protein